MTEAPLGTDRIQELMSKHVSKPASNPESNKLTAKSVLYRGEKPMEDRAEINDNNLVVFTNKGHNLGG